MKMRALNLFKGCNFHPYKDHEYEQRGGFDHVHRKKNNKYPHGHFNKLLSSGLTNERDSNVSARTKKEDLKAKRK